MNCDLILTENSCRFCLGDAKYGAEIFANRKTYFMIQRRLVDCSEIFKFLDIKIHHEKQVPDVPNRICDQCKTATCEFYILKKNFQDNEAVLFGELNTSEPVINKEVQRVFEEFMSEHKGENLKATKQSDKLVICLDGFRDNDSYHQDDRRATSCSRPSSRLSYECKKCYSMFTGRDLYMEHEKQCMDKKDIQLDDLICTDSIQSDDYFCANESHMECSELDQNEEYLDEVDDGVDEDSSYVEEEPAEIATFDYDDVKDEVHIEDNKPFICTHCDKAFVSRSGRDTHQQLKHKVPNEFHDEYSNVTLHELEIELENGELVRAWKCPTCDLVSKRKNHHQTHLIRHAIRRKEMSKQEDQKTKLVISKSETLQKEQLTDETVDVHVDTDSVIRPTNVVKKPVQVLKATSVVTNSGIQSKDEDSAKVHVQKFGNVELCTQLVCTECNVVFSSDNSFHRHRSHHLLAVVAESLVFFECSTCSVMFGNQKDFDKHNSLHSEFGYIYKPETTTRLESCEALMYDTNIEWNRIDIHCAYCTKFGSKSEMNLHMALFHGNLVCPIDRQEFSRGLNYFVDHLKIKHPELFGEIPFTFMCPHCKTTEFQQKELMVKHSRTCQAKGFSCYHCPKKFALERQLKLHLASVNGIKNHKCSDCDKGFTSRTELNVHTRSHTKDKPYKCTFPDCNKSFRTNSHRSSHMYTHNLEKKFQCKTCSAKFQTPGARRIHEKSHELVKISCELCFKEFSQRSHYVRHINDQHRIRCNSLNLEENIRNLNPH